MEFDWSSGLEAEAIKEKERFGGETVYTFHDCELSQFQLTTGKVPRVLLFYGQVYLFPYVRPYFSSIFVCFHSFECICPFRALPWEFRGIKTAASYFHDFSLLEHNKCTTKLFLHLACAYQMCGSQRKETMHVQKGPHCFRGWLWLFRMKDYGKFHKAAAVKMAPTLGRRNICTNPWIGNPCQNILGTNGSPRGKYLLAFRTIKMLRSSQGFQSFSVFLYVWLVKSICCPEASNFMLCF